MRRQAKRARRASTRSPAKKIKLSAERAAEEPLVDPRIRPLLERYVSAVGAELVDLGAGIVELQLPASERKWFRDRSSIRIAFTLDALEGDPDAEIAVIGSPLVEQLIDAIRVRGSRVSHGQLPARHEPSVSPPVLRVPITNGRAGAPRVDVAWHRVVRLVARVVVRAGGEVEEHLLESGFFDATTGIPVPGDVVEQCMALTATAARRDGRIGKRDRASLPRAAARPTADLISLAINELRRSLEPNVARLRDDARRGLHEELFRIDSYYASLLADAERHGAAAESTARRAMEAEHGRRRAEEERRYQVRVIVHPVQLIEGELLVQRATWKLVGARDIRAKLVTERWLNGAGDWMLACPRCGAADPSSLSLCKSGDVACNACASTCGVCEDVFVRDDEMATCHVDGRATCAEHGRTCSSCRKPYCTAHEATCADGDHSACSVCVMPCALCGRSVCEEHATATDASSVRGERRLCGECVRRCEGGASEHVGVDEVTRCAGCEKYVCEQHRSTCAVDEGVHCSKHLRRTDGSRRLVCEAHCGECALEPGAVYAADELRACVSCDRMACEEHSHPCVEDGRLHCDDHALRLRNEPGKFVCRDHGAICHVDRGVYRAGDTTDCPVCAKRTCNAHLESCTSCGRSVCVRDLDATQGRCVTCTRLKDTPEPSENLIAAVASAAGNRSSSRHLRTARDATHAIVEVDLGWKRRMVIAVRHGESVATTGLIHTAMGAQKLKRAG